MAFPPLVEPAAALAPAEVARYARHLLVPGVGPTGQRRLTNARVLVVGAGGLGSAVLPYLAAAGVGTLGIVDDDVVDVSNLQRQVVHGQSDVGRAKVDSARDHLTEVNPLVRVITHPVRLTADNALELLAGYDLVVDGADNFPTRYLVSDACALLGLPCVWGAVLRFDGQVSVFWDRPPAGRPAVTYRDVFPVPPAPGTVPSCAEAGVLGVVCAAVGSMMATEAVKLLAGLGEPLLGRLLTFDALSARWREVPVRPMPGRAPVRTLMPEPEACAPPVPDAVGPRELADLLEARARGTADLDLVDVREPAEAQIVEIPGSRLVPLGRFLDRSALDDLDATRPVVLYCRSGVRSAQALGILRAAGFADARHLRGGVLAWVDDVEPDKPRY